MKFQKNYQISKLFTLFAIHIYLSVWWYSIAMRENFMRQTYNLYLYILRVCIKCLHCKFHSKDNIIIILIGFILLEKKKQITLLTLYRITWLKITLISIEQINKLTFVILKLHPIIQYWIFVKKIHQKINKSYQNWCIEKTQNGQIYLFIWLYCDFVFTMFLCVSNQKLFPEGFQVNSWIFQFSNKINVLGILWNLQCIHRCFTRLYVNIRELFFNSDFQFYSLHKQLLDITKKKDIVLKLRHFIIVKLRIYKISFIYFIMQFLYNDNHYNRFDVFYIPIKSK